MTRLPKHRKAYGYALTKRNEPVRRDYTLVMCTACDLAPVNGQKQEPFRLTDIVESARNKYSLRYIMRRKEAEAATCRSCHKPLASPRKPRSLRPGWYVNEYEYHRTYGGPEEGGWWYDRAWIVSVLGPMPQHHAERYVRRYQERGGTAILYAEDRPGETAPAQHYE